MSFDVLVRTFDHMKRIPDGSWILSCAFLKQKVFIHVHSCMFVRFSECPYVMLCYVSFSLLVRWYASSQTSQPSIAAHPAALWGLARV